MLKGGPGPWGEEPPGLRRVWGGFLPFYPIIPGYSCYSRVWELAETPGISPMLPHIPDKTAQNGHIPAHKPQRSDKPQAPERVAGTAGLSLFNRGLGGKLPCRYPILLLFSSLRAEDQRTEGIPLLTLLTLLSKS